MFQTHSSLSLGSAGYPAGAELDLQFLYSFFFDIGNNFVNA